MNKNISYGISVLLLAVLAYLAFVTNGYAKDYDQQLRAKANQHMIDKKIKKYLVNAGKEASSMMTAPMDMMTKTLDKISGKKGKKYAAKNADGSDGTAAVDYGSKVRNTTIYFMIVLVVLLLTYFVFSKNVYIVTVLIASIIAWYIGVFTPIMTMEVWKELPVFGHTTFIFQSRGIWSTMEHLWDHAHYVVAIMVIIFSVLIPIVKTLALFVAVAKKTDAGIIEKIGKWSMADVFVMAILLATMSLNTEDMTTANIHMAIYFFAAYVVLSMIGSGIVDKEYGVHTQQA